MHRQLVLVLVILQLGGCAPRSFHRPQELTSCPADLAAHYDGAKYKNFKLGISFKAFKQQLEHDGLLAYLHRGREHRSDRKYHHFANYTLGEGANLSIAEIPWQPVFKFIDDNGVYRLEGIEGTVSKTSASSSDPYDLISQALTAKYGPKLPYGEIDKIDNDVENSTWTVGEHPSTTLYLKRRPPGNGVTTLSFTETTSLLDLYVDTQERDEKDATDAVKS